MHRTGEILLIVCKLQRMWFVTLLVKSGKTYVALLILDFRMIKCNASS